MITVFSKQVFEFRSGDEKVFTKLDEFATLPDWVTETPTYKLGLETGLIIESNTKVTPAKIVGSKEDKTEQPKEDEKDKKSSTNKK